MRLDFTRTTSRRLHASQVVSFLTDSNYMMRNALINEVRIHRLKIQGKILDFGCGSKPYLEEFSHCESYIGVDVAVSGHDHEKSKIDHFYDGNKLPWVDESFDSVVSFEVFEHLPNPRESIKEIVRVMKPNGVLLITVPFLYGEHEIPFDFQRWTSYGLKKFIEEQGFYEVEVFKLNQTPAFALQLFVNIFMNKIMYSPKKWLRISFIPIILISNCILLALSKILPRTHWLYSNLLVTAKKMPNEL